MNFLEHTKSHSRTSIGIFAGSICSTSIERVLDQVKKMRGRITTLWAGVGGRVVGRFSSSIAREKPLSGLLSLGRLTTPWPRTPQGDRWPVRTPAQALSSDTRLLWSSMASQVALCTKGRKELQTFTGILRVHTNPFFIGSRSYQIINLKNMLIPVTCKESDQNCRRNVKANKTICYFE